MKNPVHPGLLLKHDVLEALEISVTEGARRLGVSRVALSRVVNCKAAVSADLAVRLEKAGISTASFWLDMQSAHDLGQAWLKKQSKVVKFPVEPLRAA